MSFEHKPVLLDECVRYLNIKPEGTYADCTVGGAGHASEILKRLGAGGRFLGIDRDEDAVTTARLRLSELGAQADFDIVRSNYLDIEKICIGAGISRVNGILMDLGVSSHQLDEVSRGFSYMNDAPLDMRMDRNTVLTAEVVVNEYPERKLVEIISQYGEERWAVRIGKFIADRRRSGRIRTTGELVEVIKAAIPKSARRDGPHPAKRTFQAIRIIVNDELEVLKETIGSCAGLLDKGGRLLVISFHSLEDRIVKTAFKELTAACVCPKGAPVCVCGGVPRFIAVSKKPVLPADDEIERNPRARSAKLRVIEKN